VAANLLQLTIFGQTSETDTRRRYETKTTSSGKGNKQERCVKK
jgi:hypothetical protein